MIVNVILVVVGIAGLFFGGEWLVRGSSRLARSFGISPLIIGLTIVAFGTSTPELLVSVSAALQGISDVSIGNIVGSNIANVGLILGLAGLTYPIVIHVGLIRREIPIMLAVSILAFVLALDGQLSLLDGLVLLAGFAAFNLLMFQATLRERETGRLTDEDLQEGDDDKAVVNRPIEVLRVLVGIGILMVGANLTVDNAIILARFFQVSELFIGLTLVAVGTSLPELATSVVAAMRKESDIAIGNVVGSNIFNILFILGLTSVIQPLPVSPEVVSSDMPVMILFALVLMPLVRNKLISRREAVALLVAYLGYVIWAFLR